MIANARKPFPIILLIGCVLLILSPCLGDEATIATNRNTKIRPIIDGKTPDKTIENKNKIHFEEYGKLKRSHIQPRPKTPTNLKIVPNRVSN